jgi:hypothetical protein
MSQVKVSLTSLSIFIKRIKREATTNNNGGAVIWAADAHMLDALEELINETITKQTKK